MELDPWRRSFARGGGAELRVDSQLRTPHVSDETCMTAGRRDMARRDVTAAVVWRGSENGASGCV